MLVKRKLKANYDAISLIEDDRLLKRKCQDSEGKGQQGGMKRLGYSEGHLDRERYTEACAFWV